jgi:CheY-specific phosphatase CheX
MGNLIAGGACVELEKIGLRADITPPTIMIGSKSRISTLGVERFVVPLATKHGAVNLHVAVDVQP